MQLFFVPGVQNDELIFNETESKHAVKVLRLGKGDQVQVIDGTGGFYLAEIVDPNQKKCRLSVLKTQKEYGKRNFNLHIAIAPTKNTDRLEWFLEKATEIGIDQITPLLCEHSERKSIKPDRFERILISAMKQSVKAYLPQLNTLTSFSDFVNTCTASQKFIAHCYEGEKPHLKNVVAEGESVVVLIGPEGDFSPEEVNQAKAIGFQEISLGNARLRTETAGVVACHIVNLMNEK
ncbi:16S rRNA (uracil1498-N3)-methyltransferase [Mariniphaga anaerophila]|uniref:Ribosomal RNA small subunit methyltransferase E n=1 Tax=Mariniphaga anaerophila TaxID=1484053 RepID=A0A1M4WA27_9BACT|nr:16S rRNA (uracil(1498)-N(3))-methyltransferase [Mariniphaga anaerophila]SHE78094.1 16S rRNA (uracil1498-N3)-methyltransferase [Mariniphaga anaerophila]